MLFSGSKLKGAGSVIGLVAYCGVETRMLLNSETYRKKYSRVEENVNKWVLFILIFLALLVVGSLIGYYLSPKREDSTISVVISFTLLYSNLIPISLFVSIDIIRMIQSFMFRRSFPGYTFNTDDLNENLGQIEYLVTDKTSTFTKNKLKVKYCVFNDSKYVKTESKVTNSPQSERFLFEVTGDFQDLEEIKQILVGATQNTIVSHLLKCMSLCHSLTIINDEYLGQDEEIVLVQTANDLGYKLEVLPQKKFVIRYDKATMPFIMICSSPSDENSKRCRVLIEDLVDNSGVFYSKGEPEVMLPLLNLSSQELEDIKKNIEELTENNSRVLILAYKILSSAEIVEYKGKVQRIEKSLLNSQGKISLILKQIEKNMKFIGLVGIVEELQENVVETFERFEKSGIRVWLTSSDSYENTVPIAKEIGVIDPYSVVEVRKLRSELAFSKFLGKAVKQLIYERGDPYKIQRTVSHVDRLKRQEEGENEELLAEMEEPPAHTQITNNEFFRAITYADIDVDDLLGKPFEPFGMEFTVLIDRQSFLLAINDEKCRKMLVCVLACAKSVCFVELMPKEKSYVIKLLKENFRFSPCIAAIGSDESDISMLQLADIGISVNQNHDSLVFNYSDVVVDQFSKLDHLILVEGHYNYSRLAKVILLFLYKNCLLTLVQLAFTFICGFSGNSIYSSSLFVGFNIFFTTMPIIFIGVYDEDVHYSKILYRPQVYTIGIFNLNFNFQQMLKFFCVSVVQAVILTLFGFKMAFVIFTGGHGENFYVVGAFIYITIIVTVLVQIFLETSSYSLWYHLTMLFSVISLIIFLAIVSETDFPDSSLNGIWLMLGRSAHSFFNIFFTSLACIVPVLAYNTYQELFNSSYIELIKSNYNITTDETKLYWFKDRLADIYKSSNSWKSKLEQLKFKTSKYSMSFDLLHIETKYAENYIGEHLTEFKVTCAVVITLLVIWIILGETVFHSGIGFTLGRIVLLAGACLFLFFLFTRFFQKHYRVYTCIAILIALLSKFALEIVHKNTSFLVTALAPSLIFLVLSVHYSSMVLVSILNVFLFVISVSYEFSYKYDSGFAAVHTISAIVLITSITFITAIQGYYSEKSLRTEYELINKFKSSIEKTNSILSIMLPPFVKNRVKDGCRYIAESQAEVTIIFCDIGQFEKICKEYKPFELTRFLDTVFSRFDSLCESTGVTKIETVGKTYMACAGLKDSDKDLPPHLRKENHGRRAVEFALSILQEISEIQLKNDNKLQVKIGINSGPVSAGVVGQHKPQFSLVGDTVNTASRMCSTLESYNSIQISSSTFELIRGYHEYHFIPKSVEAKGKGTLNTYIVSESSQTNSDFAGGVSNGAGIGKIHSSCLSFLS
jgi:phospholipid-translocating P-type ATPase (flippase)